MKLIKFIYILINLGIIKSCIYSINNYYSESYERARIIKCSNLVKKVCSTNDYRQKIGLNITNNNKKYNLINIELLKIEKPIGNVKYICSYDRTNIFCTRTFLEGSLQPTNITNLGSGGLNIIINNINCTIIIFRYVYFSNMNISVIANSMFILK